jgi:hypothetical protein
MTAMEKHGYLKPNPEISGKTGCWERLNHGSNGHACAEEAGIRKPHLSAKI